MGSLLADYLVAKLRDVEIAVADLECSAETHEEHAELERLTALQGQLYRQLRAVVEETPARFSIQRISA